jgi:uncharacterized membrane protein
MARPIRTSTDLQLLAAAVAGAVTFALAATATASEHKGKEKCYGIAKAGENACHAANGIHTCAGKASKDRAGQDWMLVEIGQCGTLGGKTQPYDEAAAPVRAPPEKKGG